jgi:excisionase family DNA binding protein
VLEGSLKLQLQGGSELSKELLSVKDLSEMTSLSDYTIRKLINEGKIESVKINSSIRILRADFDSFVETLKETK